MTHRDLFIEALDCFSPRGNQAFGEAGEHAAAQLLPWPSVVAGALRSAALANSGYNSGAAITALVREGAELARLLALPGTRPHSQAFQMGRFSLARQLAGEVHPLTPMPADVVATGAPGELTIERLSPAPLPVSIQTSATGELAALLKTTHSEKPRRGLWLSGEGWQAYCQGKLPQQKHILDVAQIASRRQSVGIGMDAKMRRVEQGQLYTAEHIELHSGIGYWARIHNADACQIDSALLRLGGDGHAARLQPASVPQPPAPLGALQKHRRFALVLMSPALFANGNTPASIADGHWREHNFSARLVCHLAGRAEVISGWDLHKRRPKPARRFVPTGSVFWFDQFAGEPQALLEHFKTGHWHDPLAESEHRLTEGFNQVQLAAWHGDQSDGK